MNLPLAPATGNSELDAWLSDLVRLTGQDAFSGADATRYIPLTGTQTVTNKTLVSPAISYSTLSGGSLTSGVLTNPTLTGTVTGDSVRTQIDAGSPSATKLVTEEAIQKYITACLSQGNGLKTETGQQLQFKVMQLGSWNMDSTDSVTLSNSPVASPFTNYVFAHHVIAEDSSVGIIKNHTRDVGGSTIREIDDAGNIIVGRSAAGVFDSTSFDDTTINRGYVILCYIV